MPHGDRCGVPIEPFLTDQWYVDAKTLAKPAIAAVREGRTVFVPKNWEKTYFEWMENIQPWCISRQLWWGHQIPAWYGPDGTIFVAETEAEAQAEADAHFGAGTAAHPRRGRARHLVLLGAVAVLDARLAGRDAGARALLPDHVLVTGFDIIFFWVARMMMMGLHFMKEVPFRDVYIHALVRDEKGAKMSKSKGNVIDPLELIDKYGADALRFTLAAMAAQGRDIKLAEPRVEGYRNFATKLWNAARFAEMNDCGRVDGFDPADAQARRSTAGSSTDDARGARGDGGDRGLSLQRRGRRVYRFIWNLFCDWYLELTKPVLNGEDAAAKAETRATVACVLDQIVALLHPFMPFITEELWARRRARRRVARRLAPWPELGVRGRRGGGRDQLADRPHLRSPLGPLGDERAGRRDGAAVVLGRLCRDARRGCAPMTSSIKRLARSDAITPADVPLAGRRPGRGRRGDRRAAARRRHRPRGRARAAGTEVDKIRRRSSRSTQKLGNAQFMAKAPEEVVEEQRERREEELALLARTEAAIATPAGIVAKGASHRCYAGGLGEGSHPSYIPGIPQMTRTLAHLLAGTSFVALASLAQAEDLPQANDSYFKAAPPTCRSSSPSSRSPASAKNVILFIGDGMSVPTVTAARIMRGPEARRRRRVEHLTVDTFPYTALSKTYSNDGQVSDSAPTATAMVTGVKLNNGTIGVDQTVKEGDCAGSQGHAVKTLFEMAEEQGLATGVISTARITHATPAAMYAHTPMRDWESDKELGDAAAQGCKDIADQLVNWPYGDGLEVALGGGRRLLPAGDGRRPRGRGQDRPPPRRPRPDRRVDQQGQQPRLRLERGGLRRDRPGHHPEGARASSR